ncbi:MAG: hypothetical protein LQ341_004062 [Variospora aurantia]|nr:MAG: hypothetical protein LQ341_004062 [Variospora aurantia]
MKHRRGQSTSPEGSFQELLENNKLGYIENPLRRIPENRLSACIVKFHERHKLANVIDLATLIRGARLARDEEAFMSEEVAEKSLTNLEMSALEREKHTRIWTESRELKIILLTCCVASIAQGWVSESASAGERDTLTPHLLTRGTRRYKLLLSAQTRHGQKNLTCILGK